MKGTKYNACLYEHNHVAGQYTIKKKAISTGKKSQLFEQTYQLIVTTHWSECITRTFHAHAIKKLPNMHKLIVSNKAPAQYAACSF
jgi:hypothetical protein